MKIEMQCAVCGNYAGRHEQHWNRDRGFGCCVPCYTKAIGSDGIDSALNLYGIPGYNLNKLPVEPSLHTAFTIGQYAKKQGLDETKNPFKVPGITQRGLYAWDAFNAGNDGETFEDFTSSKLPLKSGETP
jgi:hypothetical protein